MKILYYVCCIVWLSGLFFVECSAGKNKKSKGYLNEKRQVFQKKENLEAVLAAILQKDREQLAKENKQKAEILKRFSLAYLFDPLPSSKDVYSTSIFTAKKLTDLLLQYIVYSENIVNYFKQYDDLANKVSLGTDMLLLVSGNDSDLLAINQRMRTFREHHLKRALAVVESCYKFDYVTDQDVLFLKHIVHDKGISQLARSEAQRAIYEIELYLLQKNGTESVSGCIDINKRVGHDIKNIAGEFAHIINTDMDALSGKNVSIPKQQKITIRDFKFLDHYRKKYIKLAHDIEQELHKLENQKPEFIEKLATTQEKRSKQKDRKLSAMPSKSWAAAVAQNTPVSQEFLIEQLQADPGIETYLQSTIIDWFKRPEVALQREIEKYPCSNKTAKQQNFNKEAHTFPFIIDTFIKKLSYQFESSDGSVKYVIPGSLKIAALNEEQLGFYSWIVTSDKSHCFHRSFTIKQFNRDTDLAIAMPYQQEFDKFKFSKEGKFEAKPKTLGQYTISSNGLTVAIDDSHSGNSYMLMIKRQS